MFEAGKIVEAKFALQYPLVRPATREEDITLHFDGVFLIYGREEKVDIKGHRSVNRGDDAGEYAWVELINVRGDKGWLLGEADIVAFAYYEDFILVRREELLAFTLKTLQVKAAKEPYCLYRRYGRKDLIVMIPYSELQKMHYAK